MNNRYFGNIHDFCKYGLLRRLADFGFRLGICWMLTPGFGRPEGSGYEYLDSGSMRKHDPGLFDWLNRQREQWRGPEERDEWRWGMERAQEHGLIHEADYYYGDKGMPVSITERDEYFRAMIDKFRESKRNMVFLDPDFGLGLTARELVGERGNGYLRACEVARCFEEGFSVLFYQDWRPAFEEEPARKVRDALRREGVRAQTLEFAVNAEFKGRKAEETGETRARFFLVQNPAHSAAVRKFTDSFRLSEWCGSGPFVPPHVRVGVFIDGENTYGADRIEHVLGNIRRVVPSGEFVYGRMFGKPRSGEKTDTIGKERRKLGKKHGFVPPCEVVRGNDEAELAMAADINAQIADGKVDAVVVFAKDYLNRAIARIAKERRVPFYGIGDEAGSKQEYRRECTKFFAVVQDGDGNFDLREI